MVVFVTVGVEQQPGRSRRFQQRQRQRCERNNKQREKWQLQQREGDTASHWHSWSGLN